jgi:AcrR family transcriptional regulator
MPRIVKEEEHAAKRNKILDVAHRLVYAKGYEQMTIQDILDELHISKGAFYHYFDSKGAVLEALIEHMVVEEVEPFLISIVQDLRLSALEKLHRYFGAFIRWKTGQKTLMLDLLRVWYADENAIVRQKVFTATVKQVTPVLTEIIRQGAQEGVFTTPYPDYACQVNIYLLQGLGDTFAALLLSGEPDDYALQRAEIAVAAYNDALERVLGAPSGSIHLVDTETMKAWFTSPKDEEMVPSEELTEEMEVPES